MDAIAIFLQLTTFVKSLSRGKQHLCLCKCSIIETVNAPLNNISQIEHSRHRISFNFC
ncbi:Transposase DDE domain-containing protein [Nitrosomonas sp. Nm34]|nr:Transposase DDE domain-containing protein [Nitrosomonas sp. Nm34]